MKTDCEDEIDLSCFPSLFGPENVILHKLFRQYGYELRIAGGAVRDVLLGLAPKDIDYATDATPNQMINMFTNESIRILNRNGEAHGTVTARINDKANFEVTTLRIDVEPDGRHTKVVFTDDWRLDAARRDLTVNSMFLSVNVDCFDDDGCPPRSETGGKSEVQVTGRLFDFFGGREDLLLRRIRFVGNPVDRIREDYLRILRYFRFHGRLCKPENDDSHDSDILEAITQNCGGLEQIAGERCWTELRQILLYRSTPALFRRMREAGLFCHLGLPENADLTEMENVWRKGILSRSPNPATCLASLLSTLDEIEAVNGRLKLSNFEATILVYIVKYRDLCVSLGSSSAALSHYKRQFLLSREAPNKIRPVLTEMMRYVCVKTDMMKEWEAWEPPKFPVNGLQLQQAWSVNIREMRLHLLALRTIWVDSECTLTADELLSESFREQVNTKLLNLKDADSDQMSRKVKRPRH
ncbi:tRNA-nucleotidyltransferase [Fasciola hepatica]|uniref:tRNA-nucleotidyltransferase n=1 Tax=Fasciola hepatica TaxID=6192 RepID=A0A4E0S1J9_FASHE|nr:tRNA-nucleotidyltransferase [Fasciola hepatica]